MLAVIRMVPVGVDRGLANSSKYESDGLFTEPIFATSYQPYLFLRGSSTQCYSISNSSSVPG